LRKSAGVAFALLLISKGTLKALGLEYPLFDVGIFHQLLWNLSQGNGFLSSISQAEHFLRDHLVLSLSLFTPFYRLAALNPWALGAAPGFLTGTLLASVFVAWWFLAERFPFAAPKRRAFVSSVLILSAWGFQTFYGNLHWGLHENLAGAAFISWALALYFSFSSTGGLKEKSGFLGSVLLLAFAAGSKESYLLVAAFTSLGLLVSEKKISRKSVFGLLALIFLGVFVWYAQSDRDPGKNYFTRYYGYLGADLRSMIKTLLFHPLQALGGMPLKQDLRYVWELIMPFGILPILFGMSLLVARREALRGKSGLRAASWAIGLGILPALGSGLLSSHDTLRNPNLHYFFEIIPILGFLTLFALFAIAPRRVHTYGVVFIMISWMMFWAEPWRDIIPSVQAVRRNADLIEKLGRIPPDAIVMTENGAGPWLASRKKASDWSDLVALGGDCPDYFVFQANPASQIEKTQKLADIEQVLSKCQSRRPGAKAQAKFVDSSGSWWIYSALP
jgi:hypothetical protein